MSKEIVIEDALQQGLLKSALKKQREWEQDHDQDAAVEAIDAILEQV